MVYLDRIGPWSEVKHSIIEDYASAYSTILHKKGFLTYYYIDAFAGAGKHVRKRTDELIPGSPRLACEIPTPFNKYWFIDLNKDKTKSLQEIKSDHPELDIEILQGDCNQILTNKIFPNIRFDQFRRALCVLDPYGLHLDWDVIKAAGQLKTIEIFLNFPVMDMNMNVLWRRNPKGVDPTQIARMNRFWGNDSWKEVAYESDPQYDLLEDGKKVKIPDANSALVKAFRRRLKTEGGFEYVPEPIPMRTESKADIYYLFFASPNETGRKIVSHIFDKHRV